MRWSIIIPVLNDAAALMECLLSLQPLRRDAEIIVVDGGSADGGGGVDLSLCDRLLHSPSGRATQMNAGALEAGGEWLIFLHADTALPALPYIDTLRSRVPAWGFFPVNFTDSSWRFRMLAAAMNLRSLLSAVATGDQAIFVERNMFQQLNGFADLPLMEDVEISKRLRRVTRPQIERFPVTTSPRRWQRWGFFRTVLMMWYLRLLYVSGVSPRRLADMYYGPSA